MKQKTPSKKVIHKIRSVHWHYDIMWCKRKIPLPNPLMPYYRENATHYWNNTTCKLCLHEFITRNKK